MQPICKEFFEFGQEYLERTDLCFSINPTRLYFIYNTSLNALARKSGDYYLVEICIGSIQWMREFYLAKENRFEIEELSVFKKITQIRNVSPSFFLLQLATIFYLYHEVGHLIQGGGEEVDYVEFMEHICEDNEIRTRHMRELDADWHGSHCFAMHIKKFAEIETP